MTRLLALSRTHARELKKGSAELLILSLVETRPRHRVTGVRGRLEPLPRFAGVGDHPDPSLVHHRDAVGSVGMPSGGSA